MNHVNENDSLKNSQHEEMDTREGEYILTKSDILCFLLVSFGRENRSTGATVGVLHA